MLIGIFLFGNARCGNNGIAVTDENIDLTGFVKGLCILCGKGIQLSDR